MEKLAKIQLELKAPKNQFNKFGGYKYRNCEDILEAVKPLLDGAILTVTDEIVLIGNRYYVRATATFRDGDFVQTTTSYAREAESKKGMDEAQLTGATSSYARKYALNGLFCIDDNKDADSDEKPTQTQKPAFPPAPGYGTPKPATCTPEQAMTLLELGVNCDALCKFYNVARIEDLTYDQAAQAILKKRNQGVK